MPILIEAAGVRSVCYGWWVLSKCESARRETRARPVWRPEPDDHANSWRETMMKRWSLAKFRNMVVAEAKRTHRCLGTKAWRNYWIRECYEKGWSVRHTVSVLFP